MSKEKDLNYYLSLPYTVELTREDETTWFARVAELPGCMTEADSLEEAGRMIQDAMTGWLELALNDGRPIPEPRSTEEYSGKFVVRVPKSLHRKLVEASERDNVSLNQFINTELACAVGQLTATQRPHVLPEVAHHDEMRAEYDLSGGVRGKYAQQLKEQGYTIRVHQPEGGFTERVVPGDQVVVLDADVQAVFPDSESINNALRAIISAMPAKPVKLP